MFRIAGRSAVGIGCHCGPSGLLVVDADTYKKGGHDGTEYETPTVITPQGGRHWYFEMPDGERFGNSRGKLPKHIDIRGFGGYAILPPSRSKFGKYRWGEGKRLWD